MRSISVKYNILLCASMLLLVSCDGRGQGKTVNGRADSIACHYWQRLDYADTTWLNDSTALEQMFVDWIPTLTQLTPESRAKAAETVITYGNDCPAMQLRLGELAELYFNEPNSPYRNEELYIPVLRALIAAPHIENPNKDRYRYQLEKALMNRPGTLAADFTFITRGQRKHCLYDLKSEFILIYFFNPECNDCKRVAAYISESSVFSALLKSSLLTILAIYPDEDLQAWERHITDMPPQWIVARYAEETNREAYNLPAIPNLYLLDREKKVIWKDAPVEQIEKWLYERIKRQDIVLQEDM